MALFGRGRETEGTKWDVSIGEKIKTAREEQQMSQDELAQAIHKNRVTISDYERGRTEINAVDLMGIAYSLGKPITYFYPNTPAIRGANQDELNDPEKELVHFFRKILDEDGEKLAIEHVRRIAGLMEDIQSEADALASRLIQLRAKKQIK